VKPFLTVIPERVTLSAVGRSPPRGRLAGVNDHHAGRPGDRHGFNTGVAQWR
jgi:hypothetical protein